MCVLWALTVTLLITGVVRLWLLSGGPASRTSAQHITSTVSACHLVEDSRLRACSHHVPQIARLRYNNDVVMITNTNLTLKQTLTEPLTERQQPTKTPWWDCTSWTQFVTLRLIPSSLSISFWRMRSIWSFNIISWSKFILNVQIISSCSWSPIKCIWFSNDSDPHPSQYVGWDMKNFRQKNKLSWNIFNALI